MAIYWQLRSAMLYAQAAAFREGGWLESASAFQQYAAQASAFARREMGIE